MTLIVLCSIQYSRQYHKVSVDTLEYHTVLEINNNLCFFMIIKCEPVLEINNLFFTFIFKCVRQLFNPKKKIKETNNY